MATEATRSEDATVAIDGFLEGLGFATPEARASARAVLHAGGLTNPTKRNIATRKLADATQLIEQRIARRCGSAECRDVAVEAGRELVQVPRDACEVCGGSDSRRALTGMIAALEGADARRLLIVGGSPATRTDLRTRLASSDIEVRFVEGDHPTGARQAADLLSWADVAVIWANTELSHKVSTPFMLTEYAAKRIVVPRRGVAALADTVREHLARTAG